MESIRGNAGHCKRPPHGTNATGYRDQVRHGEERRAGNMAPVVSTKELR
jgi:hypothetical protein